MAVTLEDDADQPIFEPALGETPLWQQTRLTALYPIDTDTSQVLEETFRRLPASMQDLQSKSSWHTLEEKDWEREWMAHYHPIQCSENLWICPSWLQPPQPAAINLRLDPGLAFGTGTHATTFMCLQWLASQKLQGALVMDYGCGSGILGIACLLLGARKVIGVDIDPQALLATKANMQRNQLEAALFPVYLPDQCPKTEVDFILANIVAGPLVALSDTLVTLLKHKGKICLSGILQEQQPTIEKAYSAIKNLHVVHCRENWICIEGTKT